MAVLIIDDEQMLRRSISAYLEDMDYKTLEAGNGYEGFELLRKYVLEIEIVIVDLNMPVMDGYEFIRQAVLLAPMVPILVLSGVGTLNDAMDAIRDGAWDFISKPIKNFEVLIHSINTAKETARLRIENYRYQEHLEKMIQKRTRQLAFANERVIHCLGKAAEFRDDDTGHHVVRVGEISLIIATHLGLESDFRRLIHLAAPMHDIGKVSIPDSVLLKPGPLSDNEWEIMKRHTIRGCEMLHYDPRDDRPRCALSLLKILVDQDDLIAMAQRIALCHHERWDGRGYPHGLQGTDIPLEARIVSIVDVYDALGSTRPYKKAFSEEICKTKILQARGSYFDPEIVDIFERHYDEIVIARTNYPD